jgi:hypothetical protein
LFAGCKVLQSHCVFPFLYEEQEFSKCIPVTNENDTYCQTDLAGKKAWGKCNDACLDDYGGKNLNFVKILLNKANI